MNQTAGTVTGEFEPATGQHIARRATGAAAVSKTGGQEASRRVSGEIVADAAILTATVGSMAAINREWLFSRMLQVDTWMYLGYFLHYDTADFLAGNKKIARLPWILLGFLAERATSPIVAAYVLHAGLLLAGALAFYTIARSFFGRQSAVLAALVYLTCQSMHDGGGGGWDYHNALFPLLYFLSFLAFDRTLQNSRAPLAAFAAVGALLALTLHDNLMVLLLTPAFLIHGIFRVRSNQSGALEPRRLILGVAAAICGGVAVTATLGLVNLAFDRDFIFFGSLLNRSAALLANPGLETTWWESWASLWWLDATKLHAAFLEAVATLTVLALLAAAAGIGRRSLTPTLLAIYLEFVASVAFAVIFQALGHPILQPDYMAFPLYLPMFLALAGLISQATTPVPRQGAGLNARPLGLTVLAVAAAIIVVAQVSGRMTVDPKFFAWLPAWHNKITFLFVVVALLGAAIVSRVRWPAPGVAVAAQAAGFLWLAVLLGQANANWTDDPARWKAYAPNESCPERRSILSAVLAADRILFPLFESDKHVIAWYRGGEQVGPAPGCQLPTRELGKPLYAFGYSGPMHYWEVEAAPTMPDSSMRELMPGKDILAVISNDAAYVTGMIAGLQRHDPSWREIGTYKVGDFNISFQLHLIAGDDAKRQPLTWEAVVENGATVEALPTGEIKVALPPSAWSYAAVLKPAGGIDQGAGTVTVTARLVSGSAAIGVLSADGKSFLARQQVKKRGKATEIALAVDDWRSAGALLVESGDAGGGEVILSAPAFAPKAAPASAQ